jgi:predicted MFS family arabinose efflux permease
MEDLNWSIFSVTLEVPTNRWIFAQSLPGCVGWSCIATFLPDFLHTDLGYSVKTATGLMGVFGVSGLGFSIAGSHIGQSLYNKDRARLPLFVAACTAAGAIPLMLLVLVGGLSSFLAILFAGMGGVAAATGPNLKGMLMNANPSGNRSSVFSLFSLIDNLGKGLGPSVLVMLTWVTGGNRAVAFAIAFSLWFITAWIQSRLTECFVSDVVALEVQHDDSIQREPFDLMHIYHGQRPKD